MSDGERPVPEPPELEPAHGVFTPLARAVLIEPTWIVKDLIPIGLTILGAPPKAMKSTFTMAMSCLVAGMKVNAMPAGMDVVDQPGLVLGWSYEANAGELRHMCEVGLGVELVDDGSILIADDPYLFRLDEPDGVRKLLFWLDEYKPRLAFIDPFAEFHQADEQNAGEMIRVLRPIYRWARANNAAFVVVHHTRKKASLDPSTNVAQDLRGSSALYGKADGILMFTKLDDEGRVSIAATFKRGQSWVREVQFAAYGSGAKAAEVVGEVERWVLALVKGGVTDYEAIRTQLHIGKRRVVDAMAVLLRAGLLINDGRSVRAP